MDRSIGVMATMTGKHWLVQGVFDSPFKPYTRMTANSTWTKDAAAYLDSKDEVGRAVLKALKEHPDFATKAKLWRPIHKLPGQKRKRKRELSEVIIAAPYRVALLLDLPLVKNGAGKGLLPAGGHDAGDLDNYYKAFNDALKSFGIVPDDSPRWFHGHATLGGQEGVRAGKVWRCRWAIMDSAHPCTEAPALLARLFTFMHNQPGFAADPQLVQALEAWTSHHGEQHAESQSSTQQDRMATVPAGQARRAQQTSLLDPR